MNFAVRQDGAKPGFVLMQEDEALLLAVDRGEGEPLLRFYEWQSPTISLGYHQSIDILNLEAIKSAGLEWVRRPTGGAAVLHSQELTYSVVLPVTISAEAAHIQEWVSLALADGLRKVGVDARVEERGEPMSALPNRVSCFVRTSRWEVTAGGKKIVGSAQRKLPHAILQHGSILTGDDHLRIADFLRLKDDESRLHLKHRLQERATSVNAVIGSPVDVLALRQVMEQSFIAMFDKIHSNVPTGIA